LQPNNELLDANDLYQVEEVKRAYQSPETMGKDEYYHPRLAAGVELDESTHSKPSSGAPISRERHYQSYAPKALKDHAAKSGNKPGNYILIDEQYLMQSEAQGFFVLDIKSFWLDYIAGLLKKEWQQGHVKQRPLLIPERVGVPADELSSDFLQMWNLLGFDLNLTGPKSIALRRVPSCLEHLDIKRWVQDVLYQYWQRHSDTKNIDVLQTLLIDALTEYWQPQAQTSWLDFLQSHQWRQSIFCQCFDASDLGSWMLSKAKSGAR
jgi:DNA mismatch repair protein MutL